jgi:hypothetical protein
MFIVSCAKTKVSELTYNESGKDIFIYQNGSPFDGEAWCDDGKSYKLCVECGVLNKIEYYTEKGDLLCVVSGETREKVFYNSKGSEISRSQFRELYTKEYRQWKAHQSSINKIVKEHPHSHF